MVERYYLRYRDVSNKFIDDTKTTVELMAKTIGFHDIILAYVHTNETVEECKNKKEEYIDLMLKEVKNSILKN